MFWSCELALHSLKKNRVGFSSFLEDKSNLLWMWIASRVLCLILVFRRNFFFLLFSVIYENGKCEWFVKIGACFWGVCGLGFFSLRSSLHLTVFLCHLRVEELGRSKQLLSIWNASANQNCTVTTNLSFFPPLSPLLVQGLTNLSASVWVLLIVKCE